MASVKVTILEHPVTKQRKIIKHRFYVLAWLFAVLFFLWHNAWRWAGISFAVLFTVSFVLGLFQYGAGLPWYVRSIVELLVSLYFGFKAPEILVETYTKRGWRVVKEVRDDDDR